jgi:hypothetical protein
MVGSENRSVLLSYGTADERGFSTVGRGIPEGWGPSVKGVEELPTAKPVGEGNWRHTTVQTLRDFLKQVENLPPDTLLCVAEVDEAFAAHVAEVEIIEDAKLQSRKAEGIEAIELGNGHQRVVVIRW